MILRLALLLSLLFSGCAGEKATPAEKKEPVTANPAGQEPNNQERLLRFKVDGAERKDLAVIPEKLLDVPGLPPIEEWVTLIIRSHDGREFLGARPILLTGSRTMKLVKTPQGYDFQVWQAKDDNAGYLRHQLANVKTVEVQSKSYQPPEQSKKPTLTIHQEGQRQILTDAHLRKIPTTAVPGRSEEGEVWRLIDLIQSDDKAVVLKGAGSTLKLSQDELQRKETLHLIKRNRRGEFHYRAFVDGEQESELRRLREIRVLSSLP